MLQFITYGEVKYLFYKFNDKRFAYMNCLAQTFCFCDKYIMIEKFWQWGFELHQVNECFNCHIQNKSTTYHKHGKCENTIISFNLKRMLYTIK